MATRRPLVLSGRLLDDASSDVLDLVRLHVQNHWSQEGWYIQHSRKPQEWGCTCWSVSEPECWYCWLRTLLMGAAKCGGALLSFGPPSSEVQLAHDVGCQVLELHDDVWDEMTRNLALATHRWTLLSAGTPSLRAAKALRNLCAQDQVLRRQCGSDDKLLQFLTLWLKGCKREQELAAGLLQNLCDGQPDVKLRCAKLGCIRALAELLKGSTRARAVGALANMTSGTAARQGKGRLDWRHHRELCAHVDIKLELAAIPGVLGTLVSLLRSDDGNCSLAASFTLANLCNSCPPNQALIISTAGAVDRLAWLTVSSSSAEREAAAAALWGLCGTPEHCPAIAAANEAVAGLTAIMSDGSMSPSARARSAGALWALFAGPGQVASSKLARAAGVEQGLHRLIADGDSDVRELACGALDAFQAVKVPAR